MVTLKREYVFSAAHLMEGESLHGHTYVVTVEVDVEETDAQPKLPIDARTIDAVMRTLIGNMGGRLLVSSENVIAQNPYVEVAINENDAFMLDMPTSSPEHIAEYFAREAQDGIWGDVVVTVSDTSGSAATYWRGGDGRYD